MTKKSIKKVICIAIIICIMVSFNSSLGVFAASSNNYFNESSCLAYGQSFINDTVSNGLTNSWTVNTKPSDITETYDIDGNVNAYIVNLQTNNKPSGYMLIEAFTDGEPNIMEFGYIGAYYLTSNKHFTYLKNKKIVYVGNGGFYTELNGQYYDAEYNIKTNLNKDSIKRYYLNGIKSENYQLSKPDYKIKKSISQKNGTNKINTHTVLTSSGVTSGNIANIDSFEPYTMDYFYYEEPYLVSNHCEPTCGMNMLYYWKTYKNLWLYINDDEISSFTSLRYYMKQSNVTGTIDINGYNGMQSYISNNGLVWASGSDYKDQSGFSWSWIETQINNNNPFAICAMTPDNKGAHAYLGVGYLSDSVGQYVRVVNEWDTSTEHYYQYYYSNVNAIWYYRWNTYK